MYYSMYDILRPNKYAEKFMSNIILHGEEDFIQMRKAGDIAAQILDFITPYVKEGVTTLELDTLCHNKILEMQCIPAPLNYKGFPKSICTSINKVVCHGIPSKKDVLKDGDILNIDVTVITPEGWYGDTSRMYYVGIPSQRAQHLTKITYECMMKAIDAVKPGVQINVIGKIIQEHAEAQGFSVVRDFCGHGLGKVFHTEPSVLHYYNKQYSLTLKEGMFFTIEPMINMGTYRTKVLDDKWTAVTRDGKLSAQFEHSIGVTKNGAEIFTLSKKGLHFPPY